MDDDVFVSKLNEISREHRLKLPPLKESELPSSAFLDTWTQFLTVCVKKGLSLSDSRWKRLTVLSNSPHTRFSLEGEGEPPVDHDFRVGLQLLMGMMGGQEHDEE